MHRAFKRSYNHVYTLVRFGDIQQNLGVAHLISSPYGTQRLLPGRSQYHGLMVADHVVA